MNLFSLFSKPKKFDRLSDAERQTVASNYSRAMVDLGKALEARFGKGYEAVTSPFDKQRRASVVETKGEDKILKARDRARLVNLQRDMMRNSPTRVAQDQQLRVNVVGSVGGKLYASFPAEYKDAADEVMRYFNSVWFPRAEFTYRKNFNWLLKTCLTAMDVNSTVVLVFDDGILTGGNGTGRIRGFEGDEIANVPDSDFERYFPKGFTQSQGFVYNKSGMWTGLFASTSQRGRTCFDPKLGVLKLKLDPFDDSVDTNWVMLGNQRRFNQGAPVSALAAAVNAAIDLHETAGSEAQAAKVNAQIVGQILTDASEDVPDTTGGGAFSDEVVAPAGPAVKDKEFSLKRLQSIGAVFDQMPENMRIDLLDTKRPNPNMAAYIEFLAGQVGGVKGLARVYSTMRAAQSYTAFRGEQVMTEPSFREARQDLEREVCDWAARHVIRRALKLGLIKSALPEGWERMLAWNWPRMLEVSEKDAQTALKLKLENGTTSLTRELGPGEVEKLAAERAFERKLFTDAGVVITGTQTVSGQKVDEPADDPEKTEKEGGENAE